MTPDGARVLFYSHNGVGVGHFRRQLRLAAALRARRPETVVLMATGSQAVEALNGPLGFDCISLPSIRMVDRYETWEPRRLDVSIREIMRLRADLLRRTVHRFRPDLLVADFMPAGPYGELLGALEELKAQGGRAVAGFRDIVDEPTFVRDLWSRTGVHDVLREHYSAIWIYGAREVMDFERDYGLDGDLARRLHYLGYLASLPPTTPEPVPDARMITASTGGGLDGGRLLATFIDAARLLDPQVRAASVVVGGPLLGEPEMLSLHERAAGTGIKVTRFLPGLDRRLAASELVVTMPGYNTSCELLAGRSRAIVVPRSGPSQEQRLRAGQLQRWGRARALEPDGLDAVKLASAISDALAAPPSPAPTVELRGLDRAADRFESLLAMGRAPARAA